MPRPHQVRAAEADATGTKVRWRQLFGYRTVWAMMIGFFCLNYAIYFFITWFPTYLVKERGFDLLKLGIFFVLFLVVRGTPAALLYRKTLPRREWAALGLMASTQLPLVVAITTVATKEGHMETSTAAALVGAAVFSTLVFPMLALRLRGDPVPVQLGDV